MNVQIIAASAQVVNQGEGEEDDKKGRVNTASLTSLTPDPGFKWYTNYISVLLAPSTPDLMPIPITRYAPFCSLQQKAVLGRFPQYLNTTFLPSGIN